MRKGWICLGLAAAVLLGGCSTVQEKKVSLFNGVNLDGWTACSEDPAADPSAVWSVRDGVIHCTGEPTGYLQTTNDYSDYKLHLEWRWVGEPSNSGVLLHAQGPCKVFPPSIEAQLKHGSAGDLVALQPGSRINVAGTIYEPRENWWKIIPKLRPSSEKPAGEWNTYEIICGGDTIVLTVNGVQQNRGTDASWTRGAIGLQSEGSAIEFRNIYIVPLDWQAGS